MPFTFNDFHNTSIMSSAVSASSQNSYQQYPQRNISSVVSNYDRMHRALDKHTKYYRLSPAQFIFLRRGSKWMPMLVKIFINLICLFIAIQMPADSDFDKDDRAWIIGFFTFMAVYYMITSSLYILTYPLGEFVTELPVHMAFNLLRLLVTFFLIACIHLWSGLFLEMRDFQTANQEESTRESDLYRAARIICTLILIFYILFMFMTLVPLCHISGMDGSRVRRPKAFRKFKKMTFGSLIFQQGLECGFCMERFRNGDRVVQLPCMESHIFHRKCLEDWVLNNNQTKCPYCDQPIK